MVLPRLDSDARALGWLAIVSAFTICALITLILVIWPALLGLVATDNILAGYWWIIPVSVMAISLHKVLSAWMVRREHFSQLGQRNFLMGVGQLAIQLGLGAAGVKPLGLLLGLPGGRIAGMGGALGRDGFFRAALPRPANVRGVALRYKRFPLVSSFSAVVNSLGLQAPVILLSALYGGLGFGLLALTMRVLTAPVGIISDAVSQHFESAASKVIRTGTGSVTGLVRSTVLRQLAVGSLPVLVVLISAPWLFGTIFGEEWRTSGVFAQILILGYYAQFVASPVSRALLLLELHGRQAAWDFCRATAMVGGLSLCAWAGWDLMQACTVMASIQVVSYAALLMSVIHAARKYG
jgi:O-antigen/teichoic acid export membrane protein